MDKKINLQINNQEQKYKQIVDRYLSNINGLVIGLTIVLYVVGFIIENMYLGSLRVISFEVLRIRYLVVGVLFLLFLFSVIYPIYDLFNYYSKIQTKKTSVLFRRLFSRSVNHLGYIFLGGSFLRLIAGISSNTPIPLISTPAPIIEWITQNFPESFFEMIILYIAYFLLILIVFFIYLLLAGFEQIRNQESNSLMEFKKKFCSFNKIKYLILPIPLFLFVGLIIDLIEYFNHGFQDAASQGNIGSWGIIRFIFSAILVYIFISVILFTVLFFRASDTNHSGSKSFIRSRFIYLLIYVLIIVLPLYTFGVYPHLPQQIGGGKLQQVEIKTDINDFQIETSKPNISTFLVNRSENTTILLVVDTIGNTYEAYQLNNSKIYYLNYHGN